MGAPFPWAMGKRTALASLLALALAACGGPTTADTTSTTNDSTTTSSLAPTTGPSLLPPQDIPFHLSPMAAAWETDFSKATVDLNELLVGLPYADPRDLIPPIDDPRFEDTGDSAWLAEQEPGIVIEIGGDARFYPLSILTRHEIVNDVVGGVPVAVTYCPLCNTAVAFDRRFEGEVLRLGVSGLLRNSDLVMWDDVTQTLWQQITGEAIVGDHAGRALTRLGSGIVRWADFSSAHADGQVMAPDQGFGAVYGRTGYVAYSSREVPYGYFSGPIDPRYPAMSRVVGVSIDGRDKAYPFSEISVARVANDEIGGRPVVVFWGAPDTADALDAPRIADSQGIGTGVAFDPVVEGTRLTFEASGDSMFVDHQTGTTWSILGIAIEGELEGQQLELLPHTNEFWFAWQGFFPDGEVWTAG